MAGKVQKHCEKLLIDTQIDIQSARACRYKDCLAKFTMSTGRRDSGDAV